jgi:hypothetical protein
MNHTLPVVLNEVVPFAHWLIQAHLCLDKFTIGAGITPTPLTAKSVKCYTVLKPRRLLTILQARSLKHKPQREIAKKRNQDKSPLGDSLELQ